ncbi:MAG TPA: hypothetical protein VHW72_16685, partial [Candidatus Angelobacter sp.]|nr:hypothetical protein [Candidatus Angelobacter sp.]
MPAISNIETSRHSQELFKTAHFKGIQRQIFFAMLVAFDRETPRREQLKPYFKCFSISLNAG